MIVMIVSIVFAVMFLVLAVIFLMGKGDMLIAGYNTASEEERKTIDIKRLRIVMAVDGGNRRLLHHSASPRQ